MGNPSAIYPTASNALRMASSPFAPAGSSRLWLAAALLAVLIIALPNIARPMYGDQAAYCVVARGLLHGQKLYRDVWDIKPPGIFGMYMPIVKLFGPVMWSVAVVDILWLLAISYCIFRFAERYVGTAAAAIAVLVNAEWHCQGGYVDAGQPETFLVLLVFIGYFQVWRQGRHPLARHCAAGLLMGVAFWLKYNALVFLPLLLVAPCLDPDYSDRRTFSAVLSAPWRTSLKRGGVLLAGLAAAILAVLLYFRLAGLWQALWRDHFEVIVRYGKSPLQYVSHLWLLPLVGLVVGLGGSVAAAIVAGLMARKANHLWHLVPILLGAFLGYLVAATQVRFPSYALEASYPFFAMVWGYLAVTIFRAFRTLLHEFSGPGSRLERRLVWVLLIVGFFVFPGWIEGSLVARSYAQLVAWSRDRSSFYRTYPASYAAEHRDGQMQVIAYLREQSKAGDGLYVWGTDSLIYHLTGLGPPTRFIVNHPLISPWGLPGWRQELIRDLRRHPPAFIVVARNDQTYLVTFTHVDSWGWLKSLPELNALVSTSYRQVATFPGFLVYRRVGS